MIIYLSYLSSINYYTKWRKRAKLKIKTNKNNFLIVLFLKNYFQINFIKLFYKTVKQKHIQTHPMLSNLKAEILLLRYLITLSFKSYPSKLFAMLRKTYSSLVA